MAAVEGALAGSVVLPEGVVLQIQPMGGGRHRISELDLDRMPSCGREPANDSDGRDSDAGDLAASRSPVSNPAGVVRPAGGSTSLVTIVDVVVVYTTAARLGAGGTNEILAVIAAAVAETNLAYENSLVAARIRVVATSEVEYPEAGNLRDDLEDLETAEESSGGRGIPLRRVHELRRQFQGDLVCMITEQSDGPFGVANLMHQVSPLFAKEAFAVVQRAYANAYFTFAHELGHLMGCQHDREHAAGPGAFACSYGYRFVAGGTYYHTIMAYQPGLPIPYFSNPEVKIDGMPTGIAEGLPNAANNALTINRTVSTVAAFGGPVLLALPPVIRLTSPSHGEEFDEDIEVELEAEVEEAEGEAEGEIDRIEFYANGARIGAVIAPPYRLAWRQSAAGTYELNARATDHLGVIVNSPPLQVSRKLIPVLFTAIRLALPGDRVTRLQVSGPENAVIQLEVSSDLNTWKPLDTQTLVGRKADFIDPATPAHDGLRFYRARRL
jgi:hypothetical protein